MDHSPRRATHTYHIHLSLLAHEAREGDGDFEPVEGNMEEFSLREDSLPALVVGDATLPAREQRRVRFKTIDEENRGGQMEAADDAKAEDDLEEGEPGQAPA